MPHSKESRRFLISIVPTILFALYPGGVRAQDCNRNGVDDATEIAAGEAFDCNDNGLPDGCENVPLEFRLGDRAIEVERPPQAVASGDLNGDGVSDLLTGNRGGDRISELAIAISTGREEFESLVLYPAGQRISDLAAFDFDGDQDCDVITVDSGGLFFFRNSGDGTLSPEPSIELPRFSRRIEPADFDGDGALDAVVSNSIEDSVFVLLNRMAADGAFAAPVRYGVQDQPQILRTVDFDLDGDVDVVVANERSAAVSLLLNDGAGGLKTQRLIPTDENLRYVEAVDIDGDGVSDLVAGGTDSLEIWRNDGTGVVGVPESLSVSGRLSVAGDFDRDGDADLAVAGAASQAISVLANSGGGQFSITEIAVDVISLAASDFDDDGDLDLVVGAELPPRVAFLWNGGGAVSLDPTDYPAGGPPHDIVVADFSGDGFPEIITANSDARSFTPFRGIGDGTFEDGTATTFPRSLPSIAHGDFDDDGDEDLAFGSTPLVIFWNDGFGDLTAFTDYPANLNSNARTVAAADLDGDGRPEVVGVQDDVVRVVFIDDSEGSARVDDYAVDAVAHVTLADVDGDGSQDIVAARAVRSDVILLYNRGDGTFGSPVSVAVSGSPRSVAHADFNSDGLFEFAVINEDTSDVAVFLNEGSGEFSLPTSFPVSRTPVQRTRIIAFEVDGDGAADVAFSNAVESSVTVLRGRGDGTFASELFFRTGQDTRSPASGDFDLDGDFDLVLGNRQDGDITVFLNDSVRPPIPDLYLERICTELDFVHLSIPVAAAEARRATKFVVPAREDVELLPTVFQNVQQHRLHQEFLQGAFPERFPSLTSEEYSRLTGRRDTRQYYVGAITALRSGLDGAAGTAYGFSVAVDTSSEAELLTLEEVRSIYDRLRAGFLLEPLGYLPDTDGAAEAAEKWQNPGFPILSRDTTGTEVEYVPYVRGTTYGRVRLLTFDEFQALDATGAWSLQDLLVVDGAPSDIRGIVGGVVTGSPQGELSHLFVRLARRGTPNAFVRDARDVLATFDGQLVRLEVRSDGYTIAAATLEDAEKFWESSRRTISVLPAIDETFVDLASLEEIAAIEAGNPTLPNEARFGGKASNLARLQTILTGPWTAYKERGFAVPVAQYLEFVRSNSLPSAVDLRPVTYEEYLRELVDMPQFQSDSMFRAESLGTLREHMRDFGVVNPDLVATIVARIEEELGTPANVRVRHRSSSNVEDALEFNGAGLYNSTAACVADQLDDDASGPSLCDPSKTGERDIERALKRVWSSLWNFGAYEERDFYSIPQDLASMAVLVNRAFIDEDANGVAFTGNPTNSSDRRYVVTVQAGGVSVVSPPDGALPEKNLLDVVDGEVVEIIRASSSTLVAPGEFVMSDARLRELGALMAHIDANFPMDLGEFPREQVLLDMEFKVMPDGELAVKQVRPFLLSEPPPSQPVFEFFVPPGLEMCGTFLEAGVDRGPRDELEFKSRVRFRGGTFELPTRDSSVEAEFFDEVRFGPADGVARPAGPGVFQLRVIPGAGDLRVYRFTYSQSFVAGDGTAVEIEMIAPLEFRTRGDEVIGLPSDFGESFFTQLAGDEAFRARVVGVTRARYGSCGYPTIPLWEIDVSLADGTRLVLEERFSQQVSEFDTGPASLVRADVSVAGGHQTISTYRQLVYSAFRHNQGVRYWVVLNEPVRVEGLEAPVFAIELQAPAGEQPALARYLDERFDILREVAVGAFSREPGDPALRFRRGDVDGDGHVNVSDAFGLLLFLFADGDGLRCRSAGDANDDGRLNLTDALVVVRHLFRNLGPLPPPHISCDRDPTPDVLGCESYGSCNR